MRSILGWDCAYPVIRANFDMMLASERVPGGVRMLRNMWQDLFTKAGVSLTSLVVQRTSRESVALHSQTTCIAYLMWFDWIFNQQVEDS